MSKNLTNTDSNGEYMKHITKLRRIVQFDKEKGISEDCDTMTRRMLEFGYTKFEVERMIGVGYYYIEDLIDADNGIRVMDGAEMTLRDKYELGAHLFSRIKKRDHGFGSYYGLPHGWKMDILRTHKVRLRLSIGAGDNMAELYAMITQLFTAQNTERVLSGEKRVLLKDIKKMYSDALKITPELNSEPIKLLYEKRKVQNWHAQDYIDTLWEGQFKNYTEYRKQRVTPEGILLPPAQKDKR